MLAEEDMIMAGIEQPHSHGSLIEHASPPSHSFKGPLKSWGG